MQQPAESARDGAIPEQPVVGAEAASKPPERTPDFFTVFSEAAAAAKAREATEGAAGADAGSEHAQPGERVDGSEERTAG